MIIKVCGMREAANIRAVEALGVDMIGHVFYPASPRYVAMRPVHSGLQPDTSEERAMQLEGGGLARHTAKRVGVFVDETAQGIINRVYNYRLDAIQLHGHETPALCRNLRRTICPDIRPHLLIIKAIPVATAQDLGLWREYEGAADMLLFDTRCAWVGGSGQQWDWSALSAYDGTIPFLLSGGIGPEDAGRVRQLRHPMLAGIDLNSRFETAPGVKDVERLATFIQDIRRQ